METKDVSQNPLVAAMCDGVTGEEAREVLEALDEHFNALVRTCQYNPHDETAARRLAAAKSILRRMERAAAKP